MIDFNPFKILTLFFGMLLILFSGLYMAKPYPFNRSILLGDSVPNFQAQTNQGPIDFYQWADNKWTILFSHPKAFTPVCTTELGILALLEGQFLKRNTKIIALSVDTLEAQNKWIKDINSQQHKSIDYPLIADTNKSISLLLGMIHPNTSEEFTIRSVFIIGPDKKLKLKLTYPASTGRNYGEILRVLDALQLTQTKKVVTPANWQNGSEVLVPPNMSDQEAESYFPNKIRKVLSYLRFTNLDF